jgi:hypothetical protein
MSPITELIGGAKAYGWASFADSGSFQSISSAVGTGSSNLIEFTSIPSTFKHLQVRMNALSTSGSTMSLRFNNDSSSSYNFSWLQATGDNNVSAAGDGQQGQVPLRGCVTNGSFPAINILEIANYTSTSIYKVFTCISGFNNGTGNGGYSMVVQTGAWASFNAISSIQLYTGAGNWTTNTTAALYGVMG